MTDRMPQIDVQPVPDYGDEPVRQESLRRQTDRRPFSMDYSVPPEVPVTEVAVPMPDYGNDEPPQPPSHPPPEDPPADYEDMPNVEEVALTAAAVEVASEGVHNLGFIDDEPVNVVTQNGGTESVSHHTPTSETSRRQTSGIDQTDKDSVVAATAVAGVSAAVAFTAEPDLTIEDLGEEPEVPSAQSQQAMMDAGVLAAAGVGELLGRLTEDGNLVPARPRHRGLNRTLTGDEVSQQMDELVRSRKRTTATGTQLLASPTKKLTGYKKWKYERSKEWKKRKTEAKEALANFTIWNGAFKAIEGRFGSPVLAYFRFLKWLFLLNLLLALLLLGVVILPQVLMSPETFDTYLTSSPERLESEYAQQAQNCSIVYEVNVKETVNNETIVEKILDFVQGTGWMERTPMFIGYYFNRTYTDLISNKPIYFNMSTGYLLVVVAYFLISLFLMVRYTAQGMKSSITSTSDQFYKACNKVFCGWDFSLAEKEAVEFKHNQLYQEYFRDIDVQRRKEKQKKQTKSQKCMMWSIRILINFIVLAILGAAGYLIYYMTNESITWLKIPSVANNPFLKLLVEFSPSLAITALNFIVPLIFQKLVLAEGYSPTLEIKITIFRSVTLRLASVAVLVLGVGSRILNCQKDNDNCNDCPSIGKCWETYFGQQFYKLVLLDFVTVVLMTFFVQFPRKFIVKRFEKNKLFQIIGYQEFEIPKEVLDIVYSQTLCWIGGFVSPIIFCMTVMKMFLFFYIKKLALLNTCTPSSRLFRASNSQSFFMSILLLSFVLCAIPVAFAVGRIPPSNSCGPFRIYSSEEYFMFYAITDMVLHWPHWLRSIITFITSWTFYIPLIVVICLFIYFYVSVAAGKRRHIKILLEQLALEGKDKQYLLTQVRQAIARGDFKKQ